MYAVIAAQVSTNAAAFHAKLNIFFMIVFILLFNTTVIQESFLHPET